MNDEGHIFPLIIVHLRDSVITGRLQDRQGLQASVVYTLRVMAVSYTHLDVYKRQTL